MIFTKILGNLQNAPRDKAVRRVSVEWYERAQKVLRKKLDSGEEIGICCEDPLQQDDILYEDESSIIAVDIEPCDLIQTQVHTMQEMGRLCFELGNRHLPLAISDDTVCCPYDAPTLDYLRKLSFASQQIHARFDGALTCQAHGHAHHHG